MSTLSHAIPAPDGQWHDISSVGECEHGRLIIVGAYDGKGRWCAAVRRAQRFIVHHNDTTGSLKNDMRLKWEPTHFMEMTEPNSALLSVILTKNNQPPTCCTHCNDTQEIQRPDSEFLSSCPECFPSAEAGK